MSNRYRSAQTVRLFVYMENPDGTPATGLGDVEVRIQRENGDWANFAGPTWTATGSPLTMTERDATRAPGIYTATFTPSSFAGTNDTDDYLAVYSSATAGNDPHHEVLQFGDYVNAVYQCKLGIVDDEAAGTPTDRYTAAFFRDSEPITSGITAVTLQVIRATDGVTLFGPSAMTQIGATGIFRREETASRFDDGSHYIALVSFTVDGSARLWRQWFGRDTE